MRRRSETTRLIAKASCMLHKAMGMLSDPERGIAMCTVGNTARRVALWRTRFSRSSSAFVIFPSRFLNETKYVMMSDDQG